MKPAELPVVAADVHDARRRLRGIAAVTSALNHHAIDSRAGRRVAVKVEALQLTGSFKFRGAYNAVAALSPDVRRRGVIGASSGNHAQALALAGQLLEAPVTVVVPHDAPPGKIEGARSLGAAIVHYDRDRDDRDEITADLAAELGRTIVPSANSRDIMAGAGTATLEMLTQAPGLKTILVPVGGGGLAAGTAVAAKHIDPTIKVIGVEPATAADTAMSLRAGAIAELSTVPGTIADGLRHTAPAPLPWAVNRVMLDGIVTVTDDQIRRAMATAFEYLKVVVEPSGAVALAALTVLDPGTHPVGVLITGGSVGIGSFHRLTSTPEEPTRV
ncbi:threonine/serine dehydratase [Kitasatospora sp. NPDC088134]|uniref:threonine ammonia-lyase n=1 Tax=Kitasatospora sp. NPDC088134 TaxID=3364071 RepID=UPI0038050D3D